MTGPWPVHVAIAVLVAAAGATLWSGVRLSALGDVLADRFGLGEALFGAVFFGAMISLSGIVMTATAGASGYPSLAFNNAVGGVAAQTAALGVADAVYRKANLEHAAASLSNMLFGTLVVVLLTMVLFIRQTPEVTVLGVHPGSLVLVVTYLGGVQLVRAAREEPLWLPKRTRDTTEDVPDRSAMRGRSTAILVVAFVLLGALVSGAGWAVARASGALVARGGLEESLVGAAIMGITNALPETVTSIAAVRRGALRLAVGGVLGGNAFDVLNVAVGDVAYRGGSVYHAVTNDAVTLTLASILMTALVVGGMLQRQRHGPGNVGFEGVIMIAVYIGALLLVGLT